MKQYTPVPIIAIAALTLAGCATQSAAVDRTPTLGGTAVRAVAFPVPVGPGQPREVRVLVDEPALKLATVVLRKGTVLPEHHAPVPVTIQALQGIGTVTAAGERFRIDPAHAVVLGPNVSHAVEPDAGTDLVLLVHYLGRGEEAHGTP